MIGLDTNVLLRWLIPHFDQEPVVAQIAALRAKVADSGGVCVVNPVVLAETVWIVARVLKKPVAVQLEMVEQILFSSQVIVTDRHAVEAALDGCRKGGGGGFTDHLIAALNQSAGCDTTLTFDKRAARAANFTHLT